MRAGQRLLLHPRSHARTHTYTHMYMRLREGKGKVEVRWRPRGGKEMWYVRPPRVLLRPQPFFLRLHIKFIFSAFSILRHGELAVDMGDCLHAVRQGGEDKKKSRCLRDFAP